MGTPPPRRSAPIRVLLADDRPRALAALTALLATFDDLTVVATATDGAQVLRLAREREPDVVLMDLCVPGAHGLDTRRLKAVRPQLPVVVMTMHPGLLRDAEAAGADAGLLKGASGDEIATTLRRLLDRGDERPVAPGPAGQEESTGRLSCPPVRT